MRIFSKKAYKFEVADQKAVCVQAQGFADVPDWVKNTKLFQLAKKEGSIQVIETKEKQKEVENGGDDNAKLLELREQAKNLGIPNADKMKQPTLESKIEEALKKTEPPTNENTNNTNETNNENTGGGGNND